MTSITLKFSLAGTAVDSPRGGDANTRVRLAVGPWRERARQRRHLQALGAERLADTGVSTEAAARESRKPFWLA